MRRFSPDGADVYARHLAPDPHTVGTTQTQKSARNHLTGRTRLTRFVRTTLCFSKSMRLHDSVIGLVVNRDEFGMLI
jgi:insertion element IS1 protein InsB